MTERLAEVGGIALAHESFGDPTRPTILLIMGLGTQMLGWRPGFCELLAAEGYRVVRYDNRDVGRSTHFGDHPPPSLPQLLLRRPRDPAYRLEDMADDAAGLLDALDLEDAHVVGASMGGMIAQLLAVRHPARVRSLVSVMSTTGARRVGRTALRVLPFLARAPATGREQAIARTVALSGLVGSPGFERDVAATRELAGQSFDRGPDRRGAGRQLGAILASGDRTAALAAIRAPTLVIHGAADRMVAASGGRATARAIPGARFELIDGMGHDLPPALWPRIVRLVGDQARAADGGAARPTSSRP